MEKASVQLLGFGKTGLLEPGKSETVTVEMDLKYLASYDQNNAKTYILDAGDYYFAIGNGAHAALNNILAAKGKTTADGMDDDGNPDLAKTWTCSSLDKTSFATGSTATNYALITLRGADYDDPLWEELLDQVTLEEMASLITDACGHTNPVMSVSYQGSLDKDGPIGYDATFYNEQALRELQLRAFEGAFRPDEGGVTGTMTSFSRIGLKQAAYCDELLTNVLRGEWGFAGYTITDFAFSNLMYPYASLTAGTDAFDNMISDFSAINANSLAGDAKLLSAARQATHRILYTYVNSNAMNGVAANTKVVKVTPPWKMAIQGVEIASGVLTVVCAGLYVVSVVNRKKEAV